MSVERKIWSYLYVEPLDDFWNLSVFVFSAPFFGYRCTAYWVEVIYDAYHSVRYHSERPSVQATDTTSPLESAPDGVFFML